MSYCLDANYWKGTNTLKKNRRQLIRINNPVHSTHRVYDSKGISPALTTMGGGGRQPYILPEVRSEEAKKIRVDGARVRRLTPLECMRLQGAPDEMYHLGKELGISDTQLYKMTGNAVSVPVVEAIAHKLIY